MLFCSSKLIGDLLTSKNPSVGTKLEGLILNSDSDSGKNIPIFGTIPSLVDNQWRRLTSLKLFTKTPNKQHAFLLFPIILVR